MSFEKVTVKIVDLYLDSENPRHDPIEDQTEIIDHLLHDDKVKRLAQSISERGLSPLENSGVYQNEDGHYIVVEGNRRVCALILLNDPEKSPESQRLFFKKLAENKKNIPMEVELVKFSSREEARFWIGLRHNGEQDGEGLLPWDATQKARHFDNSPNTLALKLLDYAEDKGFISKEQREKRVLTTASRFLGNPTFRESLGVITRTSEPEVIINISNKVFQERLKNFVSDLVSENSNVTSRSKKEDWEDYAGSLIEKVPSDGNMTEWPLTGSIPIVPKKTSSKSVASPNDRLNVIPKDFKPHINDPILKRIFDELKKLRCDDFILSSTILTRIFLEKIYKLMYEKIKGSYPADNAKVHMIIEEIIKHIEKDKASLPQKQKEALKALKTIASTQDHILSPQTLGVNAHGSVYPDDPKVLKTAWDNISAIVHYMIEHVFTEEKTD